MSDPNQSSQFGELIDRIDNLVGALQLPMDTAFHVKQLRHLLPEISAQLKTAYVAQFGENPWE